MCTSNRDDRKLENTVKQSRFKHLGELHKEWTEAGDEVHQESPHSDIFRKRATKPLLKQKHRQKHLVAMLSSGVGPLCFLKSTVNSAIYQEILEHFMLPSADKLYGDADFIFQQDFDTMPKVPKAGSMTMVLPVLV